MKKFLIGLFTILITFSFITLGISLNLEATIVDTFEEFIKEEVTTEIAYEVAKNTNVDKEKVKNELVNIMEKDDILKRAIEEGLDKAVDILNGKEVSTLDFTKDLEMILNNSEEILKDYGITITENEKKEIVNAMDNEKINNEFQGILQEVQANVPRDVEIVVDAFQFFRSTTLKVILISIVFVCLFCIALLKKSYYKWLGNLSEATLITGIFFTFFVSFLFDVFNKALVNSGNFILSTTALSRYGYFLIGIGFAALILNIVLSKTINSAEKSANE